jgi:hypothetical protein
MREFAITRDDEISVEPNRINLCLKQTGLVRLKNSALSFNPVRPFFFLTCAI